MNYELKKASGVPKSAPHCADRESVVTVVVVLRVDVVRVEVQFVRVVRVAGVERRRPVVAVLTSVVEVLSVAVTGSRKAASAASVTGSVGNWI